MKLRHFMSVLIGFALALGLFGLAAAADGAGVAFNLDCGGFSSTGHMLLTRDNTGTGRESFTVSAIDGLGNVIYAGTPDSFFVGGTVSWQDGGTYAWTRAPQYNPITLRVVSLAGNGQPAEVAAVAVGACAGLPTVTAGQGGGLLVTDGETTFVLDPRLLNGITSPAVPLNTAPPRPVNPVGLAEALPGYAIVNTDNLSVRSGDGPQYTLVAIVDGGTPLVVLGRNDYGADDQTWWYVQVGDVIGWVNGEYLYFRGDLTNVPVVPVHGELIQPRFLLIRDPALLYSAPNFNAAGICTLSGGLEYRVVGRDNDIVWYEIEADCDGATVTGWIPAYLGAIRNPAGLFIPVTV